MTLSIQEGTRTVRRGRPRKDKQPEILVAGPSGSSLDNLGYPGSSSAHQVHPSSSITEFDLAMEALARKVRPSTASIYRMPLEHWKVHVNSI